MDTEHRTMDQIRKLLHVAFTTEVEAEAAAYFLAARALARAAQAPRAAPRGRVLLAGGYQSCVDCACESQGEECSP